MGFNSGFEGLKKRLLWEADNRSASFRKLSPFMRLEDETSCS